MRYPLVALNRHHCRVLLVEGEGPGDFIEQLHGLVQRQFAGHTDALSYLRHWAGDVHALADLRFALGRSGTLPAGPRAAGVEGLLSLLADQILRGSLLVFESALHHRAPGRLMLAPTSGASALAGLPALTALPSVPVLPPLLPALEDLQIEGAEVMPEIDQSLTEVQASMGAVDEASLSLEPAPNRVADIQRDMGASSERLRSGLDAL